MSARYSCTTVMSLQTLPREAPVDIVEASWGIDGTFVLDPMEHCGLVRISHCTDKLTGAMVSKRR